MIGFLDCLRRAALVLLLASAVWHPALARSPYHYSRSSHHSQSSHRHAANHRPSRGRSHSRHGHGGGSHRHRSGRRH